MIIGGGAPMDSWGGVLPTNPKFDFINGGALPHNPKFDFIADSLGGAGSPGGQPNCSTRSGFNCNWCWGSCYFRVFSIQNGSYIT